MEDIHYEGIFHRLRKEKYVRFMTMATAFIVATDRISAFDVILKNKVTKKAPYLHRCQSSGLILQKDIVPNHMISVDVKICLNFFKDEKV